LRLLRQRREPAPYVEPGLEARCAHGVQGPCPLCTLPQQRTAIAQSVLPSGVARTTPADRALMPELPSFTPKAHGVGVRIAPGKEPKPARRRMQAARCAPDPGKPTWHGQAP